MNAQFIKDVLKVLGPTLAVLLISYVGCVPQANAEGTLADINTFKNLFYQSRIKVLSTSSINFKAGMWSASSGNLAHCYKLFSPKSLATLNQDGFYLEQINATELPTGLSEKQCYDQAGLP